MSDFILYCGVFAAGFAARHWAAEIKAGAVALYQRVRKPKASSPAPVSEQPVQGEPK